MIPFAVQRLDHVVLRVADLARSRRFYVEVLGCRVERERPELGLLHLRAGASMIDLVSLDGPIGRQGGPGPGEQARNVDHVCLRVDPFDEAAILAHLGRFGLEAKGPARINFGAEGEGPSLYIRDPDGNTLELKGPSRDGASTWADG
ncbi:VOC family protein [Arenimonas fontis]|uniref:VOC family protein n=1 Tax=Arenimonas fontis TaxID=2608255 RepID=A0A5B2ZDT4_9GAMM|nr:VOC family protein [Arenimonas fontis]KAA2286286.1 VOC family protein [Arenimonas fontis]